MKMKIWERGESEVYGGVPFRNGGTERVGGIRMEEKILKICYALFWPVFVMWCFAALAKIVLMCVGLT